MQREIKFRGIRTDGKGWVYGGVVYGLSGKCYIFKGCDIEPEEDDCLTVTPESVGQFTGLKDKNGKEYFFNDIVEFKDGSKGVLVWFDDRLGIASGKINNYHAIDEVSKQELLESEVIGNIHQNPELI
jgi:uncharacterized phage protein (TIGR01671 family)